MTLDAKQAATETTGYIANVLNPPPGGAELGDILGAYIYSKLFFGMQDLPSCQSHQTLP